MGETFIKKRKGHRVGGKEQHTADTPSLLGTRCCCKHFTFINSFNLHNDSMMWVLLINYFTDGKG